MTDDRRLAVLRAIVEDYVATQEPVGSKALVERHHLGVSPATIRNDMAALEEEGLHRPAAHQRRPGADRQGLPAVRRPADRRQAALTAPSAGRSRRFLDGAVDLDDVVARTVRLLAQLTRQVAVVQYPTLTRSTGAPRRGRAAAAEPAHARPDHRHRPGRAAGRRLPASIDEALLADLRARLNARRSGAGSPTWPACSTRSPTGFAPADRPAVAAVVATLVETLVEESEERIVLAGTANLTRFGHDFPQTVQPVLEALEEQVVLMRLLGEAADPDEVTVRIGHENSLRGTERHVGRHRRLRRGARPSPGSAWSARPGWTTPATIAAVRAVARYVGRILAES